jgi:type I restriction enzyme S subunit
LNFDDGEVEWKALGEISEIYGGLTGKNKQDFENGNATYIPYKNIFDNIEIKMDKLESVKVAGSEKQHTVKYGDVLFTGSSERADEAGMSSAVTEKIENSIYLNSFSFGVRFNENITLAPEFLKYLFRSHFMRKEIAKTANGVTRFNISKAQFKKLQIYGMYVAFPFSKSCLFLPVSPP